MLGSILGKELGTSVGSPVGNCYYKSEGQSEAVDLSEYFGHVSIVRTFVGASVVGLSVGVLVGRLVKSIATKASIPSTL